MRDDDSRLEEKLDQVVGEMRRMRWTMIGCALAFGFILVAPREAAGMVFLIGLAGTFAYALIRIIIGIGEYFQARREFDRLGPIRRNPDEDDPVR